MPIVDSVLEGFNGTILAYGQTSSGKTHTMLGPDIDDDVNKGIIPRMVAGIFGKIESAPEDIEFTVKVSFIEIYNEKIRDLLDPKKMNLKVREDKDTGVFVKDMTESYVGGEDEVFSLLKIGNENRAIGVTDMNSQSSRSHSCFILQIEQKNLTDFSSRTGKIFLVDLAGSERISKTGAQGETLKEANSINKSLTVLGLVIFKLTDGKSSHIPYRDSKLTHILQESLGGNSKTSLVVTCSPSIFNEQETISTLKFGQRAKQIQNKAKVNKELSVKELKYLLQKLEKELGVKNKRITSLEEYVEELLKKLGDGEGVDKEFLQKVRSSLKEQKTMEVIQTEPMEQSMVEESRIEESEESEESEEEKTSTFTAPKVNIDTKPSQMLDPSVLQIDASPIPLLKEDMFTEESKTQITHDEGLAEIEEEEDDSFNEDDHQIIIFAEDRA